MPSGAWTCATRLTCSVVASAPTVGSNHEIYDYKGVRFGLIDIGGQTSLRSSWSQYFVGTSAIILVIDSSDAGRLPLAKAELQKLTQSEVSPPPLQVSGESLTDHAVGFEDLAAAGIGEQAGPARRSGSSDTGSGLGSAWVDGSETAGMADYGM